MVFDIRNKQAEQVRWLRILHTGETMIEAKVKAAFTRALQTAASGKIDIAVEDLREDIQRILVIEHNRIGQLASSGVLRSAKEAWFYETKFSLQDFVQVFRLFIEQNGLSASKTIATTFRDRVRAIIAAGIDEGLGERDIGTSILRLGAVQTLSWAKTIARTETHQAATEAQQISIDEIGIRIVTKEWLTTSDSRARDDHRAADGQTVAKDEHFKVGGELMRRPGDSSASAAQLVNCRCTWIVNT